MKKYLIILLVMLAFSGHAQQTPESEIAKNVLDGHRLLREYRSEDTEPYGMGTFRMLNNGWKAVEVKDEKMFAHIFSGADEVRWTDCGNPKNVVYTGNEQCMAYCTVFPTMPGWDFKQVFLSVGKIVGKCTVYINGEWVGETSESGSTPEFDITPYLRNGKNNDLLIICGGYRNVSMLERLPEYTNLGIKGDITVYGKEKIYISDVVHKVNPAENGKAFVEVTTGVKSELLNRKNLRLALRVWEPGGTEVFHNFTEGALENNGYEEYVFSFTLEAPKLWSTNTPDFYTMEVTLRSDGNEPETVILQTGFRILEYSNGRITVNGKQPEFTVSFLTPVIGDRYEDAERKVDSIKQTGVNLLIARAPMTREYLDACDKAGVYVADVFNVDNTRSGKSLAVGGSLSNDPAWLPNHLSRIKRQYGNRCHHPSIIAWSLNNGGANGYNMMESYIFVKELDKDRPVINMAAEGRWNGDRPGGIIEILE